MMISTSETARDVVVLLDHLGWTKKQELHIVSISKGRMILQGEYVCKDTRGEIFSIILELALQIPNQIASLSLVATKAGLWSLSMGLMPVCYLEIICTLDADLVHPETWDN